MVKKKKVPDWLNSSLWSSTPPSATASYEDHLSPLISSNPSPPTTATTGSPFKPPPSREKPPPPPTPPPEPADDLENEITAEDITRQAQLLNELSRKVINVMEVRRIASQGIPDGIAVRSTVWKLLLGYLPPDRSQWSTELATKRSQYKCFIEELLMSPLVRDPKEVGEINRTWQW